MYCYIKLMTTLVVASILTKEVRSESTSFVTAHCFKVYNRYHNGCTGLRISTASDDGNIRDTCCHGNDTSGHEAAGYAHLSQPLGFPGYFMCDKCPEGKNKTIMNHNHHQHQHHHHHQQQQHHVKKYHHKHHNYKKLKKSLKPDFQSTKHVTRGDLKLAEERERQMKQEKRKMKLTNKTKPDKISNSVILEETDEATRETTNMEISTSSISQTTTTIQQQHETTTKSVVTKSWPTTMTTTDVGMETTKNNHHHHHHNHHHHNRHKHHHHHRKIANEADIPSTMVPTKSYATTVDHTDDWSKWSDWTPCFDTKRGCMQRRTRYCLLSSCPKSKGDDQEERICPDKISTQSNCIKAVTRKNILVRRKDKHLLGTFRTTRKVTTLPKKISPAPTSSRSSSRMTTSNRTTTATTAGTNDNNNIEGVKHTRKALQRQKLLPSSHIKINSDKSKLELSIFGKVNKIPERQYEWSAWQPCSVSCGVGVQVRKRICLIEHHHRSTKFSSKGNCSSDVVENKPCLVQGCSVNGNWSEWKVAVNCTSSPCSGEAGVMTWSRTCTNPSPSFGGKSCQGREWKREICYNNSGCSEKVDGGWCPWKNWVKSSKGSIRLRTCECPPPVNEGKHCQGPNEQTLNDAIFSTSNFHTTAITERVTMTQEYPFNECDESLGSGDGSDVSCDQEIIEKKSQLNSLSRPMKCRTNQDENYDDDDDDDDVIGGSGDLK